jgi:hypothetical protein
MAVSTSRSTGPGSVAEARGDGTTPYAVTAWTRRTGLLTCLFVAALVGVMIVTGLIRAGNRADRFTSAQKKLTDVVAEIPFVLRLPQPVPAGARLVSVITQEPDKNRGPSIYAVETIYTVVADTQRQDRQSARYIRVWQTNDVYLRKQVLDPLGDRLNPTEFGSNTWYRRTGESLERGAGVSYSTRFDDGITMVVSGPDESLVTATIAALQQ